MLKPIAAVAAILIASAFVLPTVSRAEDSNAVRVSYADLNLASPSGEHVLQGRIADAARSVCLVEDSKDLALAQATYNCRSDAIAEAQPAFDRAVAEARHGTVTVLGSAALIVTAH